MFGIDHELSSVLSVSARYVHKRLDRAIEDTGALDAQQNEIYMIGNPERGPARDRVLLADGTDDRDAEAEARLRRASS